MIGPLRPSKGTSLHTTVSDVLLTLVMLTDAGGSDGAVSESKIHQNVKKPGTFSYQLAAMIVTFGFSIFGFSLQKFVLKMQEFSSSSHFSEGPRSSSY